MDEKGSESDIFDNMTEKGYERNSLDGRESRCRRKRENEWES